MANIMFSGNFWDETHTISFTVLGKGDVVSNHAIDHPLLDKSSCIFALHWPSQHTLPKFHSAPSTL